MFCCWYGLAHVVVARLSLPPQESLDWPGTRLQKLRSGLKIRLGIMYMALYTRPPFPTVEPLIMDPPTRGQPLCKGHWLRHRSGLLYSAYYSGSHLPPEDSLHIKDKISAPKVSFIRRLRCISRGYIHVIGTLGCHLCHLFGSSILRLPNQEVFFFFCSYLELSRWQRAVTVASRCTVLLQVSLQVVRVYSWIWFKREQTSRSQSTLCLHR